MLEPDSRITYMELLRPPPGYALAKAVGTTFSADLEAILYAPLAMASKDGLRDEDGKPNPLALLDSLWRNANKMVILCQRGRILLPHSASRLNTFFNKVVFEVLQEKGSFHPKTWFLHFKSESGDERYRFVCASRNLTFDRSWDTVIALEGKPSGSENAANRGLIEYLSWLSSQAKSVVSEGKAGLIKAFLAEIPLVDFEDIYPAERVSFDFSAPDKSLKLGWLDGAERLLMISPFLQQELLAALSDKVGGGEDALTLVSSQEAMDRIDWRSLGVRFKLYAWDDLASIMGNSDSEDAGEHDEAEERSLLSGLHAKLYVAEKNKSCVIATGSANATNSGFWGVNTEFITLLEGRSRDMGIDKILGRDEGESGVVSVFDLLREYTPPEKPVEIEDMKEVLARELNEARRLLSECDLRIRVNGGEREGTFDMVVSAHHPSLEPDELPDGIHVEFWPTSLEGESHRGLGPLISGAEAVFAGVDATSVSKFISFRLSIEREGTSISTGFVLCARLIDEPADLEERALVSLVDSSVKFFQYLWFLLMDEYVSLGTGPIGGWAFRDSYIARKYSILSATPMFEDLLKKCVDDPSLVKDIDELIGAFDEHSADNSVIPKDFLSIWEVIKEGLTGEGIE